MRPTLDPWAPPEDTSSSLATLFVAIIAVILFGVIGWACEDWSCSRQWKRSGMRTSWGPVQGCLVETSPGRWIPEDRVRALP